MSNVNSKATSILNGDFGPAVQALTLSSVNWHLSGLLTKHPQLKAPINRGFIEDSRDLVKLPEMENIPVGHTLDELANWLTASYILTEGVRRTTDVNERGQSTTPYAYLKPVTPAMAINASFQWRAKMQGQDLANKAIMMGLKNAAEIAAKAAKVAEERNNEARSYALSEAESATNTNLLNWSNEELVDLLTNCPLDIEQIANDAATNAVDRAKARLEAGLWASVDEEVILFVKNNKQNLKAVA